MAYADAKIQQPSAGEAKNASSPTKPSALSDVSARELKDHRQMSTTGSEMTLSSPTGYSTYHVYHKKEWHAVLSPVLIPAKECRWGRTMKDIKEKRKQKKLRQTLEKEEGTDVTSPTCDPPDDGAFFLHTPYLAFKDPPRVLYQGGTKHARPAVLVHSSLFWKKWKLQLGPTIAEPGVLDPRGVVAWKHNGGDKRLLKSDDTLMQGYKVRTSFRLWGETGKDYVHSVKANRKAGLGPDPDVLDEKSLEPTRCEEVVYLTWTSPLSRHTRQYHFQYAGIDFFWKGTATVKEERKFGSWCRYNHLKLVAHVPLPVDDEKSSEVLRREICLAKYTSSIAVEKRGTLELFDDAILQLASEHMPSVRAEIENIRESGADAKSAVGAAAGLKRTLFYQVIVSTAMCMVVGEREKRDVIKAIILSLLGEGGNGAGGG